ncbi:MAG: ADP-ribosylglycohydrolase family protein [Proteobacteria bacterium]|nr:ADP-ribosylglycohydrolase family protein [Pseudomonadota bacterium]
MLGLAIGDALGYPCEFRSREAILATFGPAGVTGTRGRAAQQPAHPRSRCGGGRSSSGGSIGRAGAGQYQCRGHVP